MPSIRSNRVAVEGEIRPATVTHQDGVVVEISGWAADRDYGDLVVFPGLVDSHVHVNDPGRADWEGFPTATRAAAAGGATTIVDMPLNSVPPTTTVEGLRAKREAARGRLAVDVAFWGGIVPGSEPEIDDLVSEGVCGFKAFVTDSGVPEFPPMAGASLRQLRLDLPLLVHAEADDRLTAPTGGSYRDYLESRPPQAEAEAIRRLAGARSPIHILHVSSAEGVSALGETGASGETCPHYLTFTADEVSGPLFKCAPPIRDGSHREALWQGLVDGSLAMVVSDHSPSPPEMKTGGFLEAWGGISSLQLRLAASWTGASARGLDLEPLAEWLAAAPARLAGLDDRKGTISPGKAADFVVWDPDGVTRVRGADLEHRHPATPYEGMELRGRVVETVLGGDTVYSDGTVVGSRGRMLTRR